MLEILPVIPEDEKAIVDLFKREKDIWRWGIRTPWFRYWNSRGRAERWHKAVLNGEIVGSLHWSITLDNIRNLYDLVVSRDHRRQGIGRALVEFADTPAKLKIVSTAQAQEFFRRIGFSEGPTQMNKTHERYMTSFSKDHEPMLESPYPRIMTYTGRVVNPFDLKPDDIVLEDIAHGLACCNRFVGQAIKPLSVAQHSLYVSQLVDHLGPTVSIQGLLHDASEAYLGDMSKWMKHTPEMTEFRKIEKRTQATIFRKFKCATSVHPAIREADLLMLRFEGSKAFGSRWHGYDNPEFLPLTPDEEKLIGKWAPLNWRIAEDRFMAQYRRLDRMLQLQPQTVSV